MAKTKPDYMGLVEHYASCFERHGATPAGVDWPKPDDVPLRHDAMLGVIRPTHAQVSLLDLGCGYGALADHLADRKMMGLIAYAGIDLAPPMVEAARTRHPGLSFTVQDVLADPLPPQSVDYVIMNGVFTERRELSFEAMEEFFHALIKSAFTACRAGIAFNVMSAHVDWQREDLFHMPFDRLAAFLKANVSRHYIFRADYGLYEYTAYVYREPYF